MKNIRIGQKEIIHFIGVGGIGMSGLAQVMKTMGFKIQGSDLNKNKNTELPTINPILDSKSTRNYSLYNVDSMVRRSKPLQLTRESKIQSEKK